MKLLLPIQCKINGARLCGQDCRCLTESEERSIPSDLEESERDVKEEVETSLCHGHESKGGQTDRHMCWPCKEAGQPHRQAPDQSWTLSEKVKKKTHPEKLHGVHLTPGSFSAQPSGLQMSRGEEWHCFLLLVPRQSANLATHDLNSAPRLSKVLGPPYSYSKDSQVLGPHRWSRKEVNWPKTGLSSQTEPADLGSQWFLSVSGDFGKQHTHFCFLAGW